MRRFPDHQGKLYTAEIVLAFSYLHSLNIVYRDLKPEVSRISQKLCLPTIRVDYNTPTRKRGIRAWIHPLVESLARIVACFDFLSVDYRTVEHNDTAGCVKAASLYLSYSVMIPGNPLRAPSQNIRPADS